MVKAENIPLYLKENAKWCNWRYEQRKTGMTKVPYNPKFGKRAFVDNPSTFIDFNSVVSVMNNYDGISIHVDGKLIAIDLNHCIEDGKVSSLAEDIVSHFRNTYIEISSSGAELRIIIFASDGYVYDKDTSHIKKGNIEVYVSGATNRFVTITGDVYLKNEIAENTDGLQWLLDTYMKRKVTEVKSSNLEDRPSLLSDESVIAKAMASK